MRRVVRTERTSGTLTRSRASLHDGPSRASIRAGPAGHPRARRPTPGSYAVAAPGRHAASFTVRGLRPAGHSPRRLDPPWPTSWPRSTPTTPAGVLRGGRGGAGPRTSATAAPGWSGSSWPAARARAGPHPGGLRAAQLTELLPDRQRWRPSSRTCRPDLPPHGLYTALQRCRRAAPAWAPGGVGAAAAGDRRAPRSAARWADGGEHGLLARARGRPSFMGYGPEHRPAGPGGVRRGPGRGPVGTARCWPTRPARPGRRGCCYARRTPSVATTSPGPSRALEAASGERWTERQRTGDSAGRARPGSSVSRPGHTASRRRRPAWGGPRPRR